MIGYCAVTTAGGDCDRGVSGSWEAQSKLIGGTLQGCKQACSACPACNFISFSLNANDCSWFHTCSLPLQQTYDGASFRTERVRNTSSKGVSVHFTDAATRVQVAQLKQALIDGDDVRVTGC